MRIKRLKDLRSLLFLLAVVTSTCASKCGRQIDGTSRPRSNADGKYHMFISLYNRTEMVFAYMPNTRYTVTVQADSQSTFPRRFTRFLMTAEPESEDDSADSGIFDLQDELMTKYSETCPNAVVESSKVPKEEIFVAWTSPSEGSGCILIRATIFETPDTWYMDDPSLTLKMCQDSRVEADDQGPVLKSCCACDEAKYEVTFEGLWSRNTHPKDFPSKGWLIRFSDVIGASHTRDYRFWRYNDFASDGLRQVAELGSTRKLESELKSQSEHIRTIIKARGISYPNVTGKTFAVFRVDRKHHLMSLVSMLDPSPDWIVGVSGLELCLANCSWIEHKELNLYPYDAGTDSGVTYLSPDQPTEPHEPIRRITSSYPDDPRSPFYDPSGLDMKPLAKLYLNRQRLYEKACDEAPEDAVDTGTSCAVTPWGDWSDCSVTCGRGNRLRQRHYLDKSAALMNKCNVSLTDRETCYDKPRCKGGPRPDILGTDQCKLEDWSEWSSCTTTCGSGQKTRTRNFKNKKHRKQCKAIPDGPELQQTIDCDNPPCTGEDFAEKCPEDRYSPWSMWSPCSSTCGPGFHLRSRYVVNRGSADYSEEDNTSECTTQQAACVSNIPNCNITKEEAEKICSEPKEEGRCSGNILRVYFDKQTGCHPFRYSGCDGNRNNFQTKRDCENVCGDFQRIERTNLSTKNYKVSLSSILSYHVPAKEQRSSKMKRAHHEKLSFNGMQSDSQIMESSENIDCHVSEWSSWSRCIECRGYTVSTRKILLPARGKGKHCPKKLRRARKCHKLPPCSLQGDGPGRRARNSKEELSVDCEMTQWSSWSRCKGTCEEAFQFRTRMVKVQPAGPRGRLCPPMIEHRKCRMIKCQ